MLESTALLGVLYLNEQYENREDTNVTLVVEAISLLEKTTELEVVELNRQLYRAYFIIGDLKNGEKWLNWCVDKGDLESKLSKADYLVMSSTIDKSRLDEARLLYAELLTAGFQVELVRSKL